MTAKSKRAAAAESTAIVVHATETGSHARPPHQAQTEVRIEFIADIMRHRAWKRGRTGKVLAAQWGVTVHRVEQLAAMASKRVRAELTDLDGAHVDVLVSLQQVIDEGFAAGDLKAVVAAAKTYAQVTGAMAPTKIAVREDPPEKLSDEELEDLAKQAAEVISKKRGGSGNDGGDE